MIVSISYENAGIGVLAPGIATSGQVFGRGELPLGATLQATIDGVAINLQLDIKTRHEDGSAKFGILSIERRGLAPGGHLEVALAAGPGGAAQPDIDYGAALARHSFALDLTGTDDVTHHIDVLDALRGAMADGTASWWTAGPLVSQARVEVPVDSSLRLIFDVTIYKDGAMTVRQQINNDIALSPEGGRASYDVTVTLDGTLSVPELINQGQYQNWHRDYASSGDNGGQGHGSQQDGWLNIRHDIGHLEAVNVIADYNLSIGVAESLLTAWGDRVASYGWDKALTTHDVTQYMPGTGGRADIGFTTESNVAWLMTGDMRVAAFSMGQAETAGTVPWHFWDPRAGMFLNTENYANVWTDGRGGTAEAGDPNAGGLSQPPDGLTGWTLDSAHQPDLSFVPYLMTGQRWILDNLNAQAAWNVVGQYPAVRGPTDDLVVMENQVRGAAWALRQIDESAWASPDGSDEKAYFTTVSEHNWGWLVSQIPRWTEEQGEAHGWVPGVYGAAGALPPWQQDYFASTAIAAANRGNADARVFLEWQANFLIGRFTHAAEGFAQHDGVAYLIANSDPITGVPYKTWAEIGAATEARGFSNGTGWERSNGDYAQLGLATLAGLAETLGSSAAAATYRDLLADNPPFTTATAFSIDPLFAVSAPVDAPPSPTEIALSIVLGADAWLGNPIAVVLVDGVEAFRGEVAALHGDGGAVFQLGRYAPGSVDVVTVQFVNDAWGGTLGTDRNLYVEDIRIDGVSTGQHAALTTDGAIDFNLGAPAPPVIPVLGSGGSTIRIGLSGDAWNGQAHYALLFDGVVLAADLVAKASHGLGETAYIDVRADLGRFEHALTVRFTNDAFGGTPETDRNLYLDSLAINGVDQGQKADLLSDGDKSFTVADPDPVGTLRIGVSADVWQGPPRFIILVDGVQLGGERSTSASHVIGRVEYIEIDAKFAPGPHDLIVRFYDDGWGGSPATDRNLYVDSIGFNGVDLQQSAALLQNGDGVFTF